MTGRKSRPSTEPICSGGNRTDFPISSGFESVKYTGLISSYVENSQRLLVSQSVHNGCFNGCFATSTHYNPRPSLHFGTRPNHDTFVIVVMTKFNIPPGQCSQWFDDTREASLATSIWLNEKFKEGFHPTIVFKDPTSNEMLVVMTEDETRSGDFVCVFHRQLK